MYGLTKKASEILQHQEEMLQIIIDEDVEVKESESKDLELNAYCLTKQYDIETQESFVQLQYYNCEYFEKITLTKFYYDGLKKNREVIVIYERKK
ncbi:MAG: hypothetical protein ACOCP4_03875 [Candidatus Woesearchaeota archaeon]|uniref:Uncharacterized protein n=1 Tax=Arfiviricetes sp. TaxID=2832556 RepID=A0AB39A3A9_9VIRU